MCPAPRRQTTVLQRPRQGRLVHHRATAQIDKIAARLHQGQFPFPNQVIRTVAQRQRHDQEVGLAQQSIQPIRSIRECLVDGERRIRQPPGKR